MYVDDVGRTFRGFVDSFSIDVELIPTGVETSQQIFNGTFGFGQIELSFRVEMSFLPSATTSASSSITDTKTYFHPSGYPSGESCKRCKHESSTSVSSLMIGAGVFLALTLLALVISIGVFMYHSKSIYMHSIIYYR